MAPDILSIPTVPQSRLKALLQANALFHAMLSGYCFVFRSSFASVTTKSSLLVACSVGFALAFHAVFLFRVAMKEPPSHNMVALAATIDILTATFIIASSVLHLIHPSQLAIRILIAISILQVCCGITLLALVHFSSHAYAQPEVVTI